MSVISWLKTLCVSRKFLSISSVMTLRNSTTGGGVPSAHERAHFPVSSRSWSCSKDSRQRDRRRSYLLRVKRRLQRHANGVGKVGDADNDEGEPLPPGEFDDHSAGIPMRAFFCTCPLLRGFVGCREHVRERASSCVNRRLEIVDKEPRMFLFLRHRARFD